MPQTTDLICEVAIIGAGSAGLSAERAAREAGARTLLIDDRFAGTTCASVGCMPSKMLIAAGRAAHAVRAADVFGVRTTAPVIDGPAVLQRVRALRDAMVDHVLKSIEAIPKGICIRATARFVDADTLLLDDGRRIRAKAVVIATGSSPDVPAVFRALGARLLTNENLFELADLPRRVGVVGAGAIGLELAQALVRLGVEVTVFNQSRRLASLQDADITEELGRILRREIPIHLGVKLQTRLIDDGVQLSWAGESSGSLVVDSVLVATGRSPKLQGLDLANCDLQLDEQGTPMFDNNTRRCGDSTIFIAGDADGDRAVLHEASREGSLAGRNAANCPEVESMPPGVAFTIMFTDPPLVHLGARGETDLVGSASYADQGRAKVEATNAGLVKLYADAHTGALTGGDLLGPGMDHLGHLLAWAIERGDTAAQILQRPFYHPTLEEGLKGALRQIAAAVEPG